jgi:uncharacterized protein YbgA (DUF1722 family)/uncharacterized protein YbbK (DUF523 family)
MSHVSHLPRRIRLGVSSCLLGQRVRYDGNHKHDRWISDTLGVHFEFVPVCPEVAIGLGVPRPPIRLVGDPDAPRAVGRDDPALDVTAKLAAYGKRMGRELDDLSGYIFKARSPSCGMERVKVYGSAGGGKSGRGLYAAAFMAEQPLLPVEEEGRLGDPGLRENFLERVYAYRRWQELAAAGITAARLVEFHTVHKLVLMAHGPEHYRALGRLVARAGRGTARALAGEYIHGFMEALRHRATPARHANVLMHLMGYLKKQLTRDDKTELLELIHAFRQGKLPLAVPVTLLRHHFRHHPNAYVANQIYLQPAVGEELIHGMI